MHEYKKKNSFQFSYTFLIAVFIASVGFWMTWYQTYNPTEKTVTITVTSITNHTPRTITSAIKRNTYLIDTTDSAAYQTSSMIGKRMKVGCSYLVCTDGGIIIQCKPLH